MHTLWGLPTVMKSMESGTDADKQNRGHDLAVISPCGFTNMGLTEENLAESVDYHSRQVNELILCPGAHLLLMFFFHRDRKHILH